MVEYLRVFRHVGFFCFLRCKMVGIYSPKNSMSGFTEMICLAAAHGRRGLPMSYSVDLHPGLARQGETTTYTVPASHLSGYESMSEDAFGYCRLEVVENGDVMVVRLGKHPVLDELTANKISKELLGVADRSACHRLLLDFSGVAKLSSAMLAKLVTLHKKMESKGEKLRLCGLDADIRSVFTTTRLDRLFDITDTESSAIKAVVPQSRSLQKR